MATPEQLMTYAQWGERPGGRWFRQHDDYICIKHLFLFLFFEIGPDVAQAGLKPIMWPRMIFLTLSPRYRAIMPGLGSTGTQTQNLVYTRQGK